MRTYRQVDQTQPFTSHFKEVNLHKLLRADMRPRSFKQVLTTYVRPDKPFFVVLDD